MRSRFARPLAAVTAALSLVALAACGGSGGGSGSGSDPASSGSKTLSVAWTSTPPQLDPNVFTGLTWVYASDAYMATLLKYDTSVPEDEVIGVKALEPSLAESFTANADETEYTFVLRKGVMSPYGNEMTADDVVYTFERMLSNPKSLQAGVLLPTANVDKTRPVEKVDDYTVKYHLTKPSAVALSILAYPILGILDSTEVKKHATPQDPYAGEWMKNNAASFGAYKVANLVPGQEMRFDRNPNYFGEQPYFENIVLKAVPDGSARSQLLISGDVDIISEPPIDQLKKIEDSDAARVSEQADSNRHNLSVNVQDPALSKPLVRHAISHAIDREALVQAVYQGYAAPALTPQSSVLREDQPKVGGYDPELAKKELAQAGYPSGLDVALSFNSARPGPFAETLGRLIQADLKEVGINATLNAVPTIADFEAAVTNKSLPAYLYTERPAQPDIAYGMYLYLFGKSALNKSGYTNPELDALVTQALGLVPGAERDDAIEKALKIIAEDEPIISLVEVPDLAGVAQDIQGFRALPSGGVRFQELSRG